MPELTKITPHQLVPDKPHELRNSLNGVMHSIEFVAEEVRKLSNVPSTVMAYLDNVRQKSDVLLSLINKVLNAAKAKADQDAKTNFANSTALEIDQLQERGIADECIAFCSFILQLPADVKKYFPQLLKVTDFINAIERSAHHMKKIAMDFGEQTTTTQDVVFDPEVIIQEVIWMHAAQAKKKGLEIEIIFPIGEINKFLLDVQSFKQVLINLITNAIHRTSQGTITVGFKIEKQDDTTTTLQVSVSDTGCGMSPETCAQLGKPFFQNDNKGTGLGLSICKRFLAENLNGNLVVSSEVGKGSIFTFTVTGQKCVAEMSAQPPSPSKKLDEKRSFQELKGKRVLVADDDEINGKILKRFLEEEGAVCEVAPNGKEATLIYSWFKPDVVLMDLLMPVMDGIKAAEEIRKIEADNKLTRIPIVILSGEKLNEQMRKDIDDDSPKPYVRNDIFIKMVKLLNKKPLVDTAPLSPSASPGKSPGSSASSLVLVLAKHAVVCKPLVSAELPASPPLSPASALPSTPPSPALAALVLSQEFSRAHAVVCVI